MRREHLQSTHIEALWGSMEEYFVWVFACTRALEIGEIGLLALQAAYLAWKIHFPGHIRTGDNCQIELTLNCCRGIAAHKV